MNFRTEILLPKAPFTVNPQTGMLLFGSCFVENIGERLSENKFDVTINPFGILYNPLSIAQAINVALSDKTFEESDLFCYQGLYHSFLHHGDFSDTDASKSLNKINTSLSGLRNDISHFNVLFVTFGTSFVYFHSETKNVVANCHKLPAKEFTRRMIGVEDVISVWTQLISDLKGINPGLKVVFTVSPIRHWADGAHDNQLSKATLLLAIDRLQKESNDIFYFPSYEILLDDLRDYRFYAEDMVHPNNMAIEYIWEKFAEMFFAEDTKHFVKEWNKLKKAIEHKPFNSHSNEYQQFLKQTLLKLSDFCDKYPYFDCNKEFAEINNKITD